MISGESFRRCLIDEQKAKEVDEARDASRAATATANQWQGRAAESNQQAAEDSARATALERRNAVLELRIGELQKRPKFWKGLLIGGGSGFVLGVATAVITAVFVKNQQPD